MQNHPRDFSSSFVFLNILRSIQRGIRDIGAFLSFFLDRIFWSLSCEENHFEYCLIPSYICTSCIFFFNPIAGINDYLWNFSNFNIKNHFSVISF